jgi:HEPN domain-containing protein
MNRGELQQLAEERILDAKALLAARRWSGAHHMAGYAVECALKACVLAYVEKTGVIFEDRKYAERCWTHDLEELLRLAELKEAFALDIAKNAVLGQNWVIVKDWDEVSRYRKTPHQEAKKLSKAITDKASGLLPWIMSRW